jgi:hypothetical protein
MHLRFQAGQTKSTRLWELSVLWTGSIEGVEGQRSSEGEQARFRVRHLAVHAGKNSDVRL